MDQVIEQLGPGCSTAGLGYSTVGPVYSTVGPDYSTAVPGCSTVGSGYSTDKTDSTVAYSTAWQGYSTAWPGYSTCRINCTAGPGYSVQMYQDVVQVDPEYIQLNILCIKRELSFIFSAGTKNDKNKLVQVIQDDIR